MIIEFRITASDFVSKVPEFRSPHVTGYTEDNLAASAARIGIEQRPLQGTSMWERGARRKRKGRWGTGINGWRESVKFLSRVLCLAAGRFICSGRRIKVRELQWLTQNHADPVTSQKRLQHRKQRNYWPIRIHTPAAMSSLSPGYWYRNYY